MDAGSAVEFGECETRILDDFGEGRHPSYDTMRYDCCHKGCTDISCLVSSLPKRALGSSALGGYDSSYPLTHAGYYDES